MWESGKVGKWESGKMRKMRKWENLQSIIHTRHTPGALRTFNLKPQLTVMNIQIVIPKILFRSSRPGYPDNNVTRKTVDDWIKEAKENNVRTILCMLADKLSYYEKLGEGGLLKRYSDENFTVIHRPIKDHLSPPVPKEILERISSDFLTAELPMLVHCSAGIDRTGAVIDYLTEKTCLPELRKNVENIMEQHSDNRGSEHFRHVTFLALRLYDELEAIHNLSPRYRSILWVAAMLHDIGTVPDNPPPSHAWRSGIAILKKSELECGDLMRVEEIATVAALHRINGVSEGNPLGPIKEPIKELWPNGKIPKELQILAGILRVADGLDHDLCQTVTDLTVNDKIIQVTGEEGHNVSYNINRAKEKSGLLCNLLDINKIE